MTTSAAMPRVRLFDDGQRAKPGQRGNEERSALQVQRAHNICVLIMSQIELGIEPLFWGEQKQAIEPAPLVEDVVPVEVPAAKVVALPHYPPFPHPCHPIPHQQPNS